MRGSPLLSLSIFVLSVSISPCRDGFAANGPSDDDFLSAAIAFCGCVDETGLDEETLEKLYDFFSSPLEINVVSGSEMLSSGLLSRYQCAVLEDARSRTGDILSWSELSALEGFGRDFVLRLMPFISLRSDAVPGSQTSGEKPFRADIEFRSAVRNTGDVFSPSYSGALKTVLDLKGAAELGLKINYPYGRDTDIPSDISFYADVTGKRKPLRLTFGDYHLRFGQGLCLWSGFSLSGISSPENLSKNAKGSVPSASSSGSGSFRGAVAEYSWRRLAFSAFVADNALREWMTSFGKDKYDSEFLSGANVTYCGFSGQASVTGFVAPGCNFSGEGTSVLSADWRYMPGGSAFFGECAVSLSGGVCAPAFLAGVQLRLSEGFKTGLALRMYSPEFGNGHSGALRSGTGCSNEHGVALSFSHSSGPWVEIGGRSGFQSSERMLTGTGSADFIYSPEPRYGADTSSFQFKVSYAPVLRLSPSFCVKSKFAARYRTYGRPVKAEVRTDVVLDGTLLRASARLHVQYCVSPAYLSYAEAGVVRDRFSVWMRCGAFHIDNWDDRIYAYERDAPGNFNVPAYYGRGVWASLNAGLRFPWNMKLYVRLSGLLYPELTGLSRDSGVRQQKNKPGKAELKFQIVKDIISR